MPRPRKSTEPSPRTLYRDAQKADALANRAELELGDLRAASFFRQSAETLRRRARREAERRRLKAFYRRMEDEGLWKPLLGRE